MKSIAKMVLLIISLCVLMTFNAVAEEKSKLQAFPSEITLGDGPITINRAVDIAISNSRTVKESQFDLESARRKVDETKNQFGFNVTAKGYAIQSHAQSELKMPYTTYTVGAATSTVGVYTNPLTGATSQTQWYAITNPYPNIDYFTFNLNKEWSHSSELDVTKPLITFGKKKDAIKAASGQMGMSKLDVQISELDLVENVKKAFYDVLLAQEFVKVQEEAVRQAQTHFDAAKSKFEVGASPKFDVIRAEVEVASAKENLTSAKKGLDLAKMFLSNTIGLPVSNEIDIAEEGAYEKIDLKNAEYYTDIAMNNRPELEKIKIAKDVARASRRLSENKPTVAFSWSWSFYNKGGGISSSEHTWNGVIAAEVPVFDNGLAKAKVDQAARLHDKLGLNEIDAKEGITLEVKQAYLGLIEASQRIDTSVAVLASADEGYRMADVGFKEGVTTSIDLLDAEHGLTQAKLNRAKASFDYETQKARLARACGFKSMADMK